MHSGMRETETLNIIAVDGMQIERWPLRLLGYAASFGLGAHSAEDQSGALDGIAGFWDDDANVSIDYQLLAATVAACNQSGQWKWQFT